MTPIKIFGPTHLAALGATAIVWIFLLLLVKWDSPWSRRMERVLAVLLLGQWVFRLFLSWFFDYFDPASALPFHLCDVVSFLAGLALLTRKQCLIELTYYWGMAGTLNGLITPNLAHDFPHPDYFGFFILHSGVVVAALHMTISWKHFPRRISILLAFGWIQLYLAVVAVVNAIFDANYAFLRERPANASLLDALPSPPWHLLVLEPLALVMFTLLYLPFYRKTRLKDVQPPTTQRPSSQSTP